MKRAFTSSAKTHHPHAPLRTLRRIVSSLAIALLFVAAHASANTLVVNWAALVAKPEAYDGKTLTLRGFLTVRGDGDGKYHFVLWLNREAFDYTDSTASLILDEEALSGLLPKEKYMWHDFNGENISVTGVFHQRKRTELSGNDVGDLKKITVFTQNKAGGPRYIKMPK